MNRLNRLNQCEDWLQVMGILAVIYSVGLDLAGFGFGISAWCSNGGFGVCFGVSMLFQR